MFQVPSSIVRSTKLAPKGSPSERIWIIAEAPLARDKEKGYLFSSGMGWSYDKLLGEAGISKYFTTYCESRDQASIDILYSELNKYQPPIIVTLDASGRYLLPAISRKEDVALWAGSILTSPKLTYPHYIIPTFGPETCVQDWTERQIVKYIDYGKIKGEYDYWLANGSLCPLPSYRLDIDLDWRQLLAKFEHWLDSQVEYLSVDIETIYPRDKSAYFGHPGYPVTVGIAPSEHYGISFPLFQEDTKTTRIVWKSLANLLEKKKIIGQNFHSFDAWHFDMLGMKINRREVYDTMYRHAILWPELSHTLAFQTRQYTRQPYYKNMAHGWGPEALQKLKQYNAIDCCTTYKVFLEQEIEFQSRPQLR
jgi:hypothetical protein